MEEERTLKQGHFRLLDHFAAAAAAAAAAASVVRSK